MDKFIATLAILVAGLLFLFQNAGGIPWPDIVPIPPQPAPTPDMVIPAPCRNSIDAIRNINVAAQDAAELFRFFTAFAKAVENDTENFISDSEMLRTLNRWSGKLCLSETQMFGKYPGLAENVDECMARAIGSERKADGFTPVELDVTKKMNLAQALRGIAWAVNH